MTTLNEDVRSAPLKVLISTNRLISFTGSEVIALELAEAFQARGHVPLLFANAVSQLFLKHAQERGIEVSWTACPALPSFDILWSQHFLLPLLLNGKLPVAGDPRPHTVCAHLSPHEPYESATPIIEELFADEIIANSPETRAALLVQGLADVRVLPNPAPSCFAVERSRPAGNLTRILVITNHMPAELRDALDILSGEAGIQVTHVGHGGTLKRVVPQDLAECDAVVTIGKSTQYALLARIPVYCYDLFGGPGWLSQENFSAAEHANFSGRCCRRRLTAREIADEIVAGYGSARQFATDLGCTDLRRFVLDTYVESLIAAGSRRHRWGDADAVRLSQHAAQIARVQAMALAIRREVSAFEQGREEIAALTNGLAEATALNQKQHSQLVEYDRALSEAVKLESERQEEVLVLGQALAATQELSTKYQTELRVYDKALAEAQQLVSLRDREISEFRPALAEAERLVAEGQAEARRYAEALARTQPLVAERDQQINQLGTALAEAERLVAEGLAETRRYADALAEAQRLVAERDEQISRLQPARSEMERLATERQTERK